MEIPSNYQDEITRVCIDNAISPAKFLAFNSSAVGYEFYEFSYSDPGNNGNYTIIAGSEKGIEIGASVLLFDLGYRFFGSTSEFIYRPTSIATGLERAKQSRAVKTSYWGMNYQYGFAAPYVEDRSPLIDAYTHWKYMVGGGGINPWPHGHRYFDITQTNVTTGVAQAPYFLNNPHLIAKSAAGEETLALIEAKTDKDLGDSTRWNDLVSYCARHMAPICDAHFLKNASFDPNDGDNYGGAASSSDLVIEFTEAVVALIRSGATAIPGYYDLPYAAVPAARLGVLAYANHSRPPTQNLSDGIYIEVTSAFLFWGGTFQQTVVGWQEKCFYPTTIYLYPDIITYSRAEPMTYSQLKSTATDFWESFRYPGYSTEFAPQWIIDCVVCHQMFLKSIDGVSTYEDALNEVVTYIFDGDVSVRNLYRLWGAPYSKNNSYTLKQSMDFVTAMSPSWYKTMFRDYLAFCSYIKSFNELCGDLTSYPTVTYHAAGEPLLEKALNYAMSSRRKAYIHTWAFIWYLGYHRIAGVFPALSWKESPTTPWYATPTPFTQTDFDGRYEVISAEASRDATLEGTEFALMSGHTAIAVGSNPAKNHQRTTGATRLVFVGPGEVTLTAVAVGVASIGPIGYGPGFHIILTEPNNYVVTVSRGKLFVNCHDAPVRNSGSGRSYLLVSPGLEGQVKLQTNKISYYTDDTGGFTLLPPGSASFKPPSNLGPGVIALNDATTQEQVLFGNVNPFLSQDPEWHLLSKGFMEQEYPGRIEATLV